MHPFLNSGGIRRGCLQRCLSSSKLDCVEQAKGQRTPHQEDLSCWLRTDLGGSSKKAQDMRGLAFDLGHGHGSSCCAASAELLSPLSSVRQEKHVTSKAAGEDLPLDDSRYPRIWATGDGERSESRF